MPSSSPNRQVQIDVIVTAHNVGPYLSECLNSLACQTLTDFRVIIIENGSNDATGSIADAFARQDNRFNVIHREALGPAGARNLGLEIVEAPYAMLLDGDDVFHPTLLAHLHTAIEAYEADVALCDIIQFEEHPGRRKRKYMNAPWALKRSQLDAMQPGGTIVTSQRNIPGNIFAAFMGWPWDKLYRVSFLHEHALKFPTSLSNSEDMPFTYQALVLARRIAIVDQVLIEHRVGRAESVSGSRMEHPLDFYAAICMMKSFLDTLPECNRNRLKKDFLNWSLDWTLWNIESMNHEPTRLELSRALLNGQLAELELADHPAAYFTEYPRSMARYTDLLTELEKADGTVNANAGPLGQLDLLPFGSATPWRFAGLPRKTLEWILRRIRGETEL